MCVFINRQLLVTAASLTFPLVIEITWNEVMLEGLSGRFINVT